METKQCSDCEELKSLDDFYNCKSNKDGKQYKCKVCSSKHHKKYYRDTIYERKTYDKQHAHKTRDYQRTRAREYYRDNRDECLARVRTPEAKAKRRKRAKKQRYENKMRMRAQRAEEIGVLTPKPCEMLHPDDPCTDSLNKHHHDYSHPLDVNWLCKKHHSFVHRVLRAIKRAWEDEAA